MGYSKPQSPLQINGEYIYPLTTYDQIINEDGSRGYNILKKVPFLYTATFKLDSWGTKSPYQQTASVTPVNGGSEITANSVMYSSFGIDDSLTDSARNIQIANAVKLSKGYNKTFGNKTLTVTLKEKPTADIQVYFLAIEGDV